MEDREIVDLFWARDQAAIAETAEKYGKYCYSIAYNILADRRDAEECVSDAMMGLWNSIPPHRPAALAAFVGTVTRRASLRKWRSNRAAKRGGGETAVALDELGDVLPGGQDPGRVLDERELKCAVHAFLLTLRATERNVFLNRYWAIRPVGEIARRYGFSEAKVRSMLHRTRKKLKDYLIKEGLYELQ